MSDTYLYQLNTHLFTRWALARGRVDICYMGLLHGLGTSIHKFWSSKGWQLSTMTGWLSTFLFVHVTWVFFRATSLQSALDMLKSMAGFNGVVLPKQLAAFSWLTQYQLSFGKLFSGIGNAYEIILVTAIFGVLSVWGKNSLELLDEYLPNKRWTLATICTLLYALNSLDKISEFLYFNF